ncbi:MAG: methionyl-tRNA formyltransferase [Gammaproteobacteria bacterium]
MESSSEYESAKCTAVFAGTPEFAVASLRELHRHPKVDVVAVYTQPDRRAGRGRRRQLSPVKQTALDLRIPVYQPTNFKDPKDISVFAAHGADLFVVAAYGLLLPRSIIEAPRLAINVHASLLPRWRGAAPIQRCILANDQQSGISMMRIVEELDAGPVLSQQACAITPIETAGSLHDKLAELGALCLRNTIDAYLTNRLSEVVQDESQVTYAKKITADDRPIGWSNSADALERQIRALNPSPAATCNLGSLSVKIISALALTDAGIGQAGEIIAANHSGIDVGTGDGVLRITRLQPQGKKAMDAKDFVNGFKNSLLPS